MEKEHAFNKILEMENPETMFDMVCMANYFAGQFGGKMPVDENREVFDKIKKELIKI